MFLYMLDDDEQALFFKLAKLIALSDNPMLWDGESEDEPNGNVDFDDSCIKEHEDENSMIAGFAREVGKEYVFRRRGSSGRYPINPFTKQLNELVSVSSKKAAESFSGGDVSPLVESVHELLLDAVKGLPISRQNDLGQRIVIGQNIIRDILNEYQYEIPPVAAKAILFELVELCLSGDHVTSVEWNLLRFVAEKFDADPETVDELSDSAKRLNWQVKESLALIME